jgi:hypothetical protein
MLTRKKVVASAIAALLLAGMASQSWAGFEPGPADDSVAAGVTYDAVFAATSNGMWVSGDLREGSKSGWAGVFKVDLYEKGAYSHSVSSFCTNITHPTHVGDKYQVTSQLADCKVAYLVNHYPPQLSFSNMTKVQANTEAAARQAAIWHFADGFTIISPDTVKARADELVAEVNQVANCDAIPQPVEIVVGPTNQVALSGSPFYYTVTATQDGQPVAGLTVDMKTTAGVLSSDTLTTDSKGKARFSITASDPSTAVIEAKAVYIMPSGTLFQGLNPEQQILVFGSSDVQRGIATGVANATWQAPQGSITVDIFHDRNINGNKDDESEEDLKDISVHLIDATGKIVATVKTDSTGLATFSNVPNGTYTVSYVLPVNQLDTNDATSPNHLRDVPYVRSVVVNDDSHAMQFGVVKLPVVKACVFEDSMRNAAGAKVKYNRDLDYFKYETDAAGRQVAVGYTKTGDVKIGQTDGVKQADEKPLKGWLMKLYREDGSPVLGAEGVTNTNGEVIINFLRISDYEHGGKKYYIQTTQITGSQWNHSKYQAPVDSSLKPLQSDSKWSASGLITLEPNSYADACVSGLNEIPLVAVNDSFFATATGNGIVLEWRGEGMGYNVWRAQKDETGTWMNITKVTAQLLPTEATQTVDNNVVSGETYFYALETVGADGVNRVDMNMIRAATAN